MRIYIFCSILFLAILCQDAMAQSDSIPASQKEKELSEVVVTGTKTFKRKTESAVIVNILSSKSLSNLQVCNLSEGLKFQPGLRVETDCQTCNYTQLRMNGLQGGYSQILINGRPIFSPLMGLYGMELIPVNMIDRIEVIRGGGSSLYGSSAVGGTVNVITKLPRENNIDISTTYQSVGYKANDIILNGNATLVSKKKQSGISIFFNNRKREMYDANDDQFSEIPTVNNTTIGFKSFFIPRKNQKLEVSISNLHEYRFGGDMVKNPPHLTRQSEERTHNIWWASADYEINFNRQKTSLISYMAWQHTKRDHYTGIFPDDQADIDNHIQNPPYGHSVAKTWQAGIQLNHTIPAFLKGKNVLTFGSEILLDNVFDEIGSYNYLVDQETNNWGTFLQSDWDITPKWNLLSGTRFDTHNMIDRVIMSPRFALLYKLKPATQFRIGFGTGFRAPQAFDTDLHIAFAGGGVSRVRLSENLTEERSHSFSASINHDQSTAKKILGFTVEGFYTKLKNAFLLEHIGEDAFGQVFEKRNGQSASVMGATFEFRMNYNKKIQLETGFTLQQSLFSDPVNYITNVTPTRRFLRTPNDYGFANLTLTPDKNWSININYVYTGKMKMAHFGGAENFPNDQMLMSKTFSEVNSKVEYTFHIHKKHFDLTIFSGVKNIFNAYQDDFDRGKNRDSNYIYGPSMPGTLFFGLNIKTD